MNGGLLIPGNGAAVPMSTPPPTCEVAHRLLRVSPLDAHKPLQRLDTGLRVTGYHGRRAYACGLYLVARKDKGGPRLHLFEYDVPTPALIVAQKDGGPDFTTWTSYREATEFLALKDDVRPLIERAAQIPALFDPEARYLLPHLEGSLQDLGKLAPKSPGVLRLVALDAHGGGAAASNFVPEAWQGMRNFALHAFDARQTCYVEGVLRAAVPQDSTAESPPLVEFVRWGDLPVGKQAPICVRVDGEIQHYGQVLAKPAPFNSKKAPPRVPLAGLPIFTVGGESRPVTWSTE